MILLDTNFVSETMSKSPSEAVLAWLVRFDVELALSSVTIAEIAFGIKKVRHDQRSKRLEAGLAEWRMRYADRIFTFNEDAAMAHGPIVGVAVRSGRSTEIGDGMIAAIAKVNGGRLATRNTKHFDGFGLKLISPWDF